jgi:SRSO17 transposase
VLAKVEGWAAEFERLCERIGPRFARPEVRHRVAGFLRGLLGGVERKNGWQLAEHASETTPDGMQRLLATARWDADALRDDVRGYVVERLGDPGGVLVVDETGFLKKGTKSAGVQRQYSGTAGRIENCPGRRLSGLRQSQGSGAGGPGAVPAQGMVTNVGRRAEAHVPERVGFQTKPQLARQMLERAVDGHVPAGWVTADEVYGGDARLRAWLEQQDLAYVLAVKATQPIATNVGVSLLTMSAPTVGIVAALATASAIAPPGAAAVHDGRYERLTPVQPGLARLQDSFRTTSSIPSQTDSGHLVARNPVPASECCTCKYPWYR